MDLERKVFSSKIIRSNNNPRNNLHDILNVVPVQPLLNNTKDTIHHCDFLPKGDKFYVPKKKNGRKVQTVHDIRNSFERDVYSYLPAELETQRNILLRKIRYGFSRDKTTKELAVNMLKSDTPMLKTAWQMLMNINPEEQKFSSQYILWKGKNIQVNGSKGGQHKFICNYDVGKYKLASQKISITKSKILPRKRQLLHHSLNVKFKPGPLSKKNHLDALHQKYQFGELKLVTLPKTGLEIETSCVKPLAPVIDTFISRSFFHNDGLISHKWANFAVSVLAKTENGILYQNQSSEDFGVTFDINYKCFQNRILMRNDHDIIYMGTRCETTSATITSEEDSLVNAEILNVMNDVLNAVEISLLQNEMYIKEDEPREVEKQIDKPLNTITTHSNTKSKRNGELRRLDVTVITISETLESGTNVICQNDYCALGCICDSLKCYSNLKRHCGRIDCLFTCKCDFSKYKYMSSLDNDDCCDIIPGLIDLDKTLGQTLAKEEHKFHQTVIVKDAKSILLKSDKRNWKASKKYADFYSNMRLKLDCNKTNMLSIVCKKLDFKNVEPWCMVHNLYKCFCKGKFTVTGWTDKEELKIIENESANTITMDNLNIIEKSNEIENIKTIHEANNTPLRQIRYSIRQSERYSKMDCILNESCLSSGNSYNATCARVQPYSGRKYNDEYYNITNKKIAEMEKNDKKLRRKMVTLINNDSDIKINKGLANTKKNAPSNLKQLLNQVIEQKSYECIVESNDKRIPVKTKLVDWLETNYKQYKQRAELGFIKSSLDPPKAGRLALHTWEFVLGRYRERKNHFLISKQKPFRIFMAIDIPNIFFENCTNISDIALSDIDKYPTTIKNLLTNVTDLKEYFCILYGLEFCWELIGSVTKITDRNDILHEETHMDNFKGLEDNPSSEANSSSDSYIMEDLPITIDDGTFDVDKKTYEAPKQNAALSETEICKWFVMKLEHDFSEIQFCRKGFFVKYESILKAINVSKVSGKTVRLSSQTVSNDENNAQFGIYAVPSNEDHCVFIGPYQKDQNLDIDYVKKTPSTDTVDPQFRSRGIWITTNQSDNLQVIDNPLQFIPTDYLNNDNLILLESASTVKSNEITSDVQNEIPQQNNTKQTRTKQVKPIKIPKTNGFYHLTPNGCLKPIQLPGKNKSLLRINTKVSNIRGSSKSYYLSPIKQSFALPRRPKKGSMSSSGVIPIAQVAPYQVKAHNDDYSISAERKKIDCGMFVLKPEEINKRSLHKKNKHGLPETSRQSKPSAAKDEMSMDIENFLSTSVVCTPPRDEVFAISDDEIQSTHNTCPMEESCKNIWVVCKNVENLGWIAGQKNSESCISFEFPGFKPSPFYLECEALKKISQIFARKVYVPRHIKLQWQVLESEAEICSNKKLAAHHLFPDYILTKKGFKHKKEVMLETATLVDSTEFDIETPDEGSLKQKTQIMDDLEETSRTLEDESTFLWGETIAKKDQLLKTFLETPEELRCQITDHLNSMISNSEEN